MKLIMRLRRFRRDDGGMALVEFAMVLPVMVLLYLGGVAVTQGVMTNRKVVLLNHAMGDMVSQVTDLTAADATKTFGAAAAILAPYSSSSAILSMRVSSVKISATGAACVEWSTSPNSGYARAAKSDVTSIVPSELRVANTWLIMPESTYAYTPIVGVDITGTINMQKTLFLRPRASSRVTATYLQSNLSACT